VGYRLSPLAEADIDAIARYIAEHNPVAAVNLIRKFMNKFELLTVYPHAGMERKDIMPEVRHLVLGEYIAFYRIENGNAVVLRVIHGRRNIGPDDVQT
jgi:toxin ParE1/3/4